MELDLGCTSRIYFDNAGDNVMLTLHNVMLMLQNYVYTIISVIAANQTVINEVYVFTIKYHYFIEKHINFIYSADLTF